MGDELPDMPAYLDSDMHVSVPLEATYRTAWSACPAGLRELAETGKLADETE